MDNNNLKEEALGYHKEYFGDHRPGKITILPTKTTETQKDLSLAYSPGVAYPCLEIEKNIDDAYLYTNKANLVGVITNGTAVLGLGDIGALASKPVMEGKAVLFKVFSGIDSFDIEINSNNIDDFCKTVENISLTFGGINLEDIKAPECFEIERILKERLDIPVMHDDQHGTAIVASAALINALEILNKKKEDVKIVVNGAGASALSCSKMLLSLGFNKDNLILCDTKGVVNRNRLDLNEYKLPFSSSTTKTKLEEVIVGADVFLGFSKANILTVDMLKSMAKDPVVFAMANPNPEIDYNLAMSVRDDLVMGTGRSDFPNQVNNVLAFPFIFRGALDVNARSINEEMKKAVVYALANIAKKEVPGYILDSYKIKNISFGKEYLLPKPLDRRLIEEVSIAVAKAAIETGVARKVITDWDSYRNYLKGINKRDCSLPSISNCFIG